ncbi:dUTP diphosphatase [bacterium]|nr:dUTP diphosphatase [bacterium]
MATLKIAIVVEADARDLPLPVYQTPGSAGMDLLAAVAEQIVLKPGEFKLIPTGIRIAVPDGYEAQVRPRSGLAFKYGIGVMNGPGTIDSDYRGPVGVILFNFGPEPFEIRRGDRIAQMVIARHERAEWVLADSLDESQRGSGGFGSTG